ncbi:MAG: T9SS type A sorting domain-containing protein, partial [Fidelibacterota bacterium]
VNDGGFGREDFYLSSLQNIGFDTADVEYWNIGEHDGIDKSVTTWGWNTIIVFGWGTGTVPTRDYSDNPYAQFLMMDRGNSTNNLLLSDQDHFWTNGEPDKPAFSPGDFDYDFLGLAGGINDPGKNADSIYTGVAADILTDPFSSTGKELYLDFGMAKIQTNWVDYTRAGTATPILYSQSGSESGVRHSGNAGGSDFKTVFFPFPLEAAGDTSNGAFISSAQLDTLMKRIMKWFNPQYTGNVRERKDYAAPSDFTLNQNYPNPFNPGTSITYELPERVELELSIYNILGQRIKNLFSGERGPGKYNAYWDGTNESDEPVSSGIYFSILKTENQRTIIKMTLIR